MELSLVDPGLRSRVRWMPRTPVGPIGRAAIRLLLRGMPATPREGVRIETVDALAPPLRLYRPVVPRSSAALLWIHGGGYVIGRPVQDDALCGEVCARLGIVVASVGYRLAPEHPFPAPADDCLAGWTWLREHAAGLGVDPARLAIGGQSAGGGLAAGLVQRLRDRAGDGGGEAPRAQWLFAPMLDDRTAMRAELDGLRHFVWDNRRNRIGWRAFLGREPGGRAPAYAVPARRADLSGLPPTWIGVGAIDLFRAEDEAYAERLRAAGVDAVVACVPGAPHGFEAWAARTALARSYVSGAIDWLGAALADAPAMPR